VIGRKTAGAGFDLERALDRANRGILNLLDNARDAMDSDDALGADSPEQFADDQS